MMDALIAFLSGINSISNYIGGIALEPLQSLPGWISLTIISAVLGIVIFIIFTLTANRQAFTKILDDIKANILAVLLFKDNFYVTMKSEVRLLACSGRLLWYSIIPVLVMSIPLSLILAQMASWYQNRPVLPGSESVLVSLKLNSTAGEWPEVTLREIPEIEVLTGPVRLFSRGEIYWEIKPLTEGSHNLIFQADDRQFSKTLSAGTGFMRLSPNRPGHKLLDMLLYPLEKPFSAESSVASISVGYPERPSKIYGTDWWVLYFCIVSMIFALVSKPFIKIRT